MLELHLEKVTVRTNERDVSYFVLNFGGVFYEGPGTKRKPKIVVQVMGKFTVSSLYLTTEGYSRL